MYVAVLMVPELVVLNAVPKFPEELTELLTACRPTWHNTLQTSYEVFKMVALYYLPLILMGFTYGQIVCCLWSKAIPTESSE